MSTEDEPGSGVSKRLGYLFKHAAMLMERLNAEALAPLGIDGRELGVLLALADHEPGSQQQVAHRLSVDRTTMVALFDALEDKGLVTRQPHAEDRRRNVVELTSAGEDTLRQATQASDSAEHALLATLDAQDAQRLRVSLQKIVSVARPGSPTSRLAN